MEGPWAGLIPFWILSSRAPAAMADDPVTGEPVCEANSLLTGKLTGKFADSCLSVRFLRPVDQQNQGLAGKFPTQPNREFFEFEQGI
jgi:hypothetical protein